VESNSTSEQKKTILVADDDEKFALMIASALEQAGFKTIRAIDGELAVQKIKADLPDFVLLDIMMPKKIGFEVLEEIKGYETTKNIPVFTFSHLSQPSDIEKSRRLGSLGHIVKTDFSIRELVEKIQSKLR